MYVFASSYLLPLKDFNFIIVLLSGSVAFCQFMAILYQNDGTRGQVAMQSVYMCVLKRH